jgi:glycerate kinase
LVIWSFEHSSLIRHSSFGFRHSQNAWNTMRVIVAPDKFKSCLSAAEVAQAIAAGLRAIDPSLDLDLCPLADGGEGTVQALVAATGGRLLTRNVTGPLPDMRVTATYGLLGDGQTAVIEMAAASGLHLLAPEQRNPMNTTTYGTGQLILSAVENGAKRIILGIGGSATTDAGLGCAQACGLVSSPERSSIFAPLAAPELCRSVRPHASPITPRDFDTAFFFTPIQLTPLAGVEFLVACDVSNPLFGPSGAAPIFSPQKGATAEQVRWLDAALERLARRLNKVELAQTPGAGAAGGLGFGMLAFFGARLRPGIELVMEAARLRDRLKGADLCISGEGKLDAQSLGGKTPIGVARLCREMRIPCIALAGSIEDSARPVLAELFVSLHALHRPPVGQAFLPAGGAGIPACRGADIPARSLDDCIRNAAEYLAEAAAQALADLRASTRS